MLRRKRTLGILAVTISVPVIGVTWWLLAPLFTSTTVEEEFPFVSTATIPPDTDRAQVEQVTLGLAKVDESADEKMPPPASESAKASNTGDAVAMDDVVDTLAESGVKAMPGDMTTSEKEKMTRAMAQEMKDALPEAMAEAETPPITEPVRLKSGQFRDQDRFHKGSSTSTIYRLPDGSQLSKSGRPPSDQRSGLVGHPHAESKPGRSWGGNWSGHLELAKLKGNTGNQNYPIPDDAYI